VWIAVLVCGRGYGADPAPKSGAPISEVVKDESVGDNMIGAYGQWASGLSNRRLPLLSFRNPQFQSADEWRKKATDKAVELLLIPDMPWKPDVRVEKQFEFDGLSMEALSGGWRP